MRLPLLILVLMVFAVPAVAYDTVYVSQISKDGMLYSALPDNNNATNVTIAISQARKLFVYHDTTWIDSVDAVITPGDTCIEAKLIVSVSSIGNDNTGTVPFYGLWKDLWNEGIATGSNGADPAPADSSPTYNDWANDDYEWGTAGADATQDISGTTDYFNRTDGGGADRTATAFGSLTYDRLTKPAPYFDTVAIDPRYINIAYNNNHGIGVIAGYVTSSQTYTVYAKDNGGATNDPRWMLVFGLAGAPPTSEGRTASLHEANRHEANKHGD